MSPGDIERLNRMYECSGYSDSYKTETTSSLEQQAHFDEISSITTTLPENKSSTTTDSTEASLNNTSMDDDSDDMVLTKEQIDALFSTNFAKRNGLKSIFHHWQAGVVPYEIDPNFSEMNFKLNFMQILFSKFIEKELIPTINEAMNYISNRSCVRFVPKTLEHANYIFITKGPGCSSEVGMRRTGKQMLNLNENGLCPRGKIIHELLHALGFLHMHTAK